MNYQWSREQKWNQVRVSTVQCLHALSKGPKLRYLLGDEINEVSLQKTCWYSRTQSGNCWWFDNCGSQSCQWRKWITKQSPIPVVVQDLATQWSQSYPFQNKNFSRNPEEPNGVPGADEVARSHLFLQFFGNWQILWRNILESLYVNATQIRNKWDCWVSSTQSERRQVCGTVAIKSGQWMAGGFLGMLLLSAKHSRSLVWWKPQTPDERRFGKPFNGPIIPFGSLVEYYSISAKDQSRIH